MPAKEIKKHKMILMPTHPSKCQFCAVDHQPDEAHNKESLFYQVRFHTKHGRFPTWADAVAHCSMEIQKQWKKALIKKDVWSEPEDGKVIAEKDEKKMRPESKQIIADFIDAVFNSEHGKAIAEKDKKLNARCHFCGSENIILSDSCKTCCVCGESLGDFLKKTN